MRAATNTTYGTPQVLSMAEVERPVIGPKEVLVEVHASPVTQGDRRLRAADFPGISWLPGRLMIGIFGPKHTVPGTMFAGRIVEVGEAVTRFSKGERVFGSCMYGAQAEFLAMPADGTIARMPTNLDYDEAAAISYGAVTALIFLRDLAKLEAGERVLIIGASGGVGRFAIQVAKHLGATVTGLCSRDQDLVRELGADHVIDYTRDDFTKDGERYDVIFDTSEVNRFRSCRGSLTKEGRYLSLHASAGLMLQVATTALRHRIRGSGQRAIFGVAMGEREDLERVRELVEAGALRPVIARRYPLEEIVDAHSFLEASRPRGSVVVRVSHENEHSRGISAAPGIAQAE